MCITVTVAFASVRLATCLRFRFLACIGLIVHPRRPQLYRSTPYAERGFYRACGTPLTFRYLRSGWIAISIGSLDPPDVVRPEMHWGIESQVSWLALHDDLPRKSIEGDPEYMAWRQPLE